MRNAHFKTETYTTKSGVARVRIMPLKGNNVLDVPLRELSLYIDQMRKDYAEAGKNVVFHGKYGEEVAV